MNGRGSLPREENVGVHFPSKLLEAPWICKAGCNWSALDGEGPKPQPTPEEWDSAVAWHLVAWPSHFRCCAAQARCGMGHVIFDCRVPAPACKARSLFLSTWDAFLALLLLVPHATQHFFNLWFSLLWFRSIFGPYALGVWEVVWFGGGPADGGVRR